MKNAEWHSNTGSSQACRNVTVLRRHVLVQHVGAIIPTIGKRGFGVVLASVVSGADSRKDTYFPVAVNAATRAAAWLAD